MTDDPVVLHKDTFDDLRMESPACPLCRHEPVLIVRREIMGWGEFGFYQCPECGSIFDVCNMVDKPMGFEEMIRELDAGVYYSLRSFLMSISDFPGMPREVSRAHKAVVKIQEDLDRDDRSRKCSNLECAKMFVRAPSAKSMLTLDYCPSCRKSDIIRGICKAAEDEEKAEKKAAKAKAKANKIKAAKAAKTRAANKKAADKKESK